MNISKLADHSQGWPKGSLSIATILRCREGTTLPWIAPVYPCSTPYNAEC